MYRIERTSRFDKEIRQLDKSTSKYILRYINKNILPLENLRLRGKALQGNLSGLWRYRIGDYRLICKVEDDKLLIFALSLGHRREIYK